MVALGERKTILIQIRIMAVTNILIWDDCYVLVDTKIWDDCDVLVDTNGVSEGKTRFLQ